MREDRIHRAVSDDGTEIVGRVCGQGPPLVLVHGAVADGESEWAELLPYLTDRFTCYLPSLRGRGGSGTHPDHSREARVRDVTAFVESIGEPVGLLAVSGGGMPALGAAARTPAVTALAAFEPVVMEAIGDDLLARFRRTLDDMVEVFGQGRAVEAVGLFLDLVANDEEAAALSEDAEGLDELLRHLPVDLEEFREAYAFEGPSPTDPSVLGRIAAPTLLLHGSRTALPWFADGVRFAAEHVPDATVREVAGVGHFGHVVDPGRFAAELVPFLEACYQTA